MHPHSVGRHHHPSPPERRDVSSIPDVPDVIEQHAASVHVRGLAPPRNEGLQRGYVYSL